MPLYEYACRACGHEFELLVLGGSAEPPTCPSCTSADLERLLSGFAVSSASTRGANIRAAKKKAAGDPNRRDKHIAERDFTREHFIDDGIILPPLVEDKK